MPFYYNIENCIIKIYFKTNDTFISSASLVNVKFWFRCQIITLFKILKFLNNFKHRYNSFVRTHDNQYPAYSLSTTIVAIVVTTVIVNNTVGTICLNTVIVAAPTWSINRTKGCWQLFSSDYVSR